MTAAALLFLLACAYALGHAARPRSWRPPASIPQRVVCADCDGPRLVRADGSCYTCGSTSTLRPRRAPATWLRRAA